MRAIAHLRRVSKVQPPSRRPPPQGPPFSTRLSGRPAGHCFEKRAASFSATTSDQARTTSERCFVTARGVGRSRLGAPQPPPSRRRRRTELIFTSSPSGVVGVEARGEIGDPDHRVGVRGVGCFVSKRRNHCDRCCANGLWDDLRDARAGRRRAQPCECLCLKRGPVFGDRPARVDRGTIRTYRPASGEQARHDREGDTPRHRAFHAERHWLLSVASRRSSSRPGPLAGAARPTTGTGGWPRREGAAQGGPSPPAGDGAGDETGDHRRPLRQSSSRA